MPAEESALHPARGRTAARRASGAIARNMARRHGAFAAVRRPPLQTIGMQQRLTPLWLTLDRGENRARVEKEQPRHRSDETLAPSTIWRKRVKFPAVGRSPGPRLAPRITAIWHAAAHSAAGPLWQRREASEAPENGGSCPTRPRPQGETP